uniref:BCL2 antagonist/killer 1 n=1 Tax=Ornithorhynchus anatinus TaxID=9258 RepID=A0A6I8PFV0_ORNAN
MDCGQDPGPAAGRPCREGRSRSRTPSSSAEEQVAMETEAVFHSYVFHRYQQEQESSGGQSPRDPEMAAISHNPGSVMEQVGRQLAIIGDDINRRYEPEFQGMLLILRPTEENAFTYFTKIACRSAVTPTQVICFFLLSLRSHPYPHSPQLFPFCVSASLSQVVGGPIWDYQGPKNWWGWDRGALAARTCPSMITNLSGLHAPQRGREESPDSNRSGWSPAIQDSPSGAGGGVSGEAPWDEKGKTWIGSEWVQTPLPPHGSGGAACQ